MSISPLELRLGNLVDVINEEGLVHGYTVFAISNDSISVMKDGIGMVVEPKDLSPITLTEDWVVKFGFIKSNDKALPIIDAYEKDGLVFDSDFVLTIEGKEGDLHSVGNPSKYVHQLQNLYLALTGTELTIKETV